MALPYKGNHPVKLLRNQVTLKPADRVDIHKYLSQYLTNLMHNIFVVHDVYFMPLHVSSKCAHPQEVKIALHGLWYHHTETSEWSKILFW